jgi:hyperosmotically inducible periplasmic protein
VRFVRKVIMMMKTLKNRITMLLAIFLIAGTTIASPKDNAQAYNTQLHKQIRKELVTLPYYGVFDNIAYRVDGSTVTLYGQVIRPSTRKDAERRIADIEGIERVVNKIEVLPLSPFDDDIRRQAYYTIFNTSSLYRYAMGTNPSIHIVVNRGHITLEGVVANEMDSQLAYMAARTVPGAFSVTNNLRSERRTVR